MTDFVAVSRTSEERITEIRGRLDDWKMKAISCVDFSALDVDALFSALNVAEDERDEARELHGKLAIAYSDAVHKLNLINKIIAAWSAVHPQAGFEKEAVAGYSIACGNAEATMIEAMKSEDCLVCGEVHRIGDHCQCPICVAAHADPEAVAMNGAFVGPVPHE
jgi:CO dehydrogenase nickel-insertion accessory protein CooC1